MRWSWFNALGICPLGPVATVGARSAPLQPWVTASGQANARWRAGQHGISRAGLSLDSARPFGERRLAVTGGAETRRPARDPRRTPEVPGEASPLRGLALEVGDLVGLTVGASLRAAQFILGLTLALLRLAFAPEFGIPGDVARRLLD